MIRVPVQEVGAGPRYLLNGVVLRPPLSGSWEVGGVQCAWCWAGHAKAGKMRQERRAGKEWGRQEGCGKAAEAEKRWESAQGQSGSRTQGDGKEKMRHEMREGETGHEMRTAARRAREAEKEAKGQKMRKEAKGHKMKKRGKRA